MKYIIFNKPFDVLSQFTPNVEGEKTLADFGLPKDVYAVGRLDKDSEGLLLLSDDGPFINRLINPKYEKEKKYWVQVEGLPTASAIELLKNGVMIQGVMTMPCLARILSDEEFLEREIGERNPPVRFRKNIPTTWIEIVLKEGRNRQVRRMTAAVGFPTLRLMRVQIGKCVMPNELRVGEWTEINRDDIV